MYEVWLLVNSPKDQELSIVKDNIVLICSAIYNNFLQYGLEHPFIVLVIVRKGCRNSIESFLFLEVQPDHR